MRVLMLESHPGVASGAVARLTEAGHTIVRCDTADREYPCRGLAPGGQCPLDEPVDVAVLVQEAGTAQVEPGAVCAARARIPVLEVTGAEAAVRSPLAAWVAPSGPDLLAACERVARDGRAHTRAIEERLVALGVVDRAEIGRSGPVTIDVVRSANRLQLTIRLDDAARSRRMEIVRAATQALRDFDPRPAVIDVAVRAAEPVGSVLA
ncbi:MAG TPA: hypothetical protein VGK49_06500 [Ilumatobacteraceae bacterium]|jgi:hypothetical protein